MALLCQKRRLLDNDNPMYIPPNKRIRLNDGSSCRINQNVKVYQDDSDHVMEVDNDMNNESECDKNKQEQTAGPQSPKRRVIRSRSALCLSPQAIEFIGHIKEVHTAKGFLAGMGW